MIEVLLNNETDFEFPQDKLREVVSAIARDYGYREGEISLAVIDDSTMHTLNREHLQHDYPTDVLSFLLESDGRLEGEVIVSADTAQRVSLDYGWPAIAELLLYFIHGTLHLVGHDDHSDEDQRIMREKESHYLRTIGLKPPEKHVQRQPNASATEERSA